jgi:hypothetical protein
MMLVEENIETLRERLAAPLIAELPYLERGHFSAVMTHRDVERLIKITV